MNTINFNQSVGFPLETEILDEMQKAWSILNSLGALAGNYSIISGCEVDGTSVGDGYVYIDGELLEFKGGVADKNVIIAQEPQLREFEDNNLREVIYVRYVTFGTATTQWPWEAFKRGMPTIDIPAALALKEDKAVTANLVARLLALEARNVPLIQITSGQDTVNSRLSNVGSGLVDNYDYNYFDVNPPSGYTLANLAGFMASANQIDFQAEVNNDDWLFCKYKPYPVVNPTKIRIICANSENGSASKVNWMAVWIKY